MAFKNAKNYERKLRLALIGPPKSGKSFTALTLACALAGEGGKVAVIDTENASAAKYAELFPPFDVSELERFNPDDYVREIKEAERLGYDVLVIDSLTHAWNGPGGLLEYKDQIARSGKPGMNSYTAWSEASPKHTRLMHAITHSTLDVIVTMRTKVEYVLEEDERGKQKPVRIGLAPIQRDDTEYEFDIMGVMDRAHNMSVEGSRCPELDNQVIAKPGREVADILQAWLSGIPAPERPSVPTAQEIVDKGKAKGLWDTARGFFPFATAKLSITVTPENWRGLTDTQLLQLDKAVEEEQPGEQPAKAS